MRHPPAVAVAAALATAAVGLLLGTLSLTWRLDQSLYDGTLSLWNRPVADDIVIVAIDDASLAQIGRWPWPRAVHATLLEQLAPARPRAIALDLLLSEPDPDPRADALLAAAMLRAAPVVLPAYFYALPTQGLRPLAPVPPLAAAAARIAHMDAEADADGVLRHAWLRAGLTGDGDAPLLPHLALALLEAAGEPVHPSIPRLQAPAHAAPPAGGAWRRDQRVAVRFAGPPGTVTTVSYVDVLRGAVRAQAFAGKLVLVGATAPGLGDLHPTPVSGRAGAMAGVEVAAQLAHALRAGDGLRSVPPWAVGALAALLAVALHLLCAGRSGGAALRLTAVALAAVALASALLPGAGLWLPPATLLLTVLLFYPLWSWQRLAQAQHRIDDELARWPGARAQGGGDPIARRLDALRAAGDALRQSRQRLADSLEALPEAALVTDDAGRVQVANTQAAQLLGAADASALHGRPLAALLAPLTPLEATGWPALLGAARAAVGVTVTRAQASGDHGMRDLLARLAPFGYAGGADGDGVGLVVSVADVTRLTAAERSRDEVLAFVSHDLRAPQASLLAMVELARFGRLTLAPDELLDQVEQLAARTLAMADEFLRLGSVDAQPLQLAPLDLAQPVREALADVAPQAQLREVQLAQDLPQAPIRVLGEGPLLRRAVVNLLTNALRASAPGDRVEVTLTAGADAAELRVRDHGPGLAAELRQRLFQRYERASSDAHRPALLQSVGLGLALVDSVARRHGGRVSVDSEPGQGACFTLRLPLTAADAPRTPDRSRAA